MAVKTEQNCADAPLGVSAFLAFGSNIGDRMSEFRSALRGLRENGFQPEVSSSVYETEPVGCEPGAAPFYNAVIGGRWNASAESLLKLCLHLEQKAGRPTVHPHWHSRILDIDLLLFGESILHTDMLTLPHPRIGERLFVLVPLAEIAPHVIVPGSGLTVLEQLDVLKKSVSCSASAVKRIFPPFFCDNFS